MVDLTLDLSPDLKAGVMHNGIIIVSIQYIGATPLSKERERWCSTGVGGELHKLEELKDQFNAIRTTS